MLLPSSALSFLRRFAIALLAVVVIATVGFVSAQAYGKREFAKSRTIRIPDGILTPSKPGQPANYLLIGSDVRPADETAQEAQAYGTGKDVGPQHSDVMIVLHVDPAAHTGMLVSFPRDLMVQIPGHGRDLLNAAFAYNGAPLVIQTLEANFAPMKINHYLEVDFRGFKKIVNEIGHIRIYFPTPAHDPFTGLNIDQAGCVSLNGDQALAYARSRHYYVPKDVQNPAPWQWNYTPGIKDSQRGGQGWVATGSDIDRIPRQQYFLRTVSQAAIDKSGSDVLKVASLLDAIFGSLGHDQTLKQSELNSLALTFRGLSPSKVQMLTLPTIPDPTNGNRVVSKFPDAGGVIALLSTFTAPPKTPVVKPLAANKVTVRVVNGSGVKGAATRVLDAFTAEGFKSGGDAVDADKSDYKTQVRYAPGKFNQGYTIATAVGTANLVPAASEKNTLGGDALLIVGTDYDSLTHRFDLIPRPAGVTIPTATTSTTGASASTTSTTVAKQTVDTRFVPVDPKTGGTLVGCPSK
ncbi:MAG: transcriptional attenuator, LytR family [Actinomycetia bacterium]|nr:transcriptional attenuator, LytR family [Actinomycetes bacterium]